MPRAIFGTKPVSAAGFEEKRGFSYGKLGFGSGGIKTFWRTDEQEEGV
jgi:hypothetical protein